MRPTSRSSSWAPSRKPTSFRTSSGSCRVAAVRPESATATAVAARLSGFPASIEKISGREGTRAEKRDRHDAHSADAGEDEASPGGLPPTPPPTCWRSGCASCCARRSRLRTVLSAWTTAAACPSTAAAPSASTSGSAPENADKLVGTCSPKSIDPPDGRAHRRECAKVREQSRQSLETASKQNGYLAVDAAGEPPARPRARRRWQARRDRIDRITPEKVHEAARKYFPPAAHTGRYPDA